MWCTVGASRAGADSIVGSFLRLDFTNLLRLDSTNMRPVRPTASPGILITRDALHAHRVRDVSCGQRIC